MYPLSSIKIFVLYNFMHKKMNEKKYLFYKIILIIINLFLVFVIIINTIKNIYK